MTRPVPDARVARHAAHVNPQLVKLLGVLGYGRVYERALGTTVWDAEGRGYLDLLAGFGALNIGHNHPRLAARLRAYFDEEALNLCHFGITRHAADLAAELAKLCGPPLDVTLFGSSGAEGVDAALKLARAATRRPGFVYCHGGFHGNNLGPLSIMGDDRLRKPFEPLLADCSAVPFGDLPALERALQTKRVAAFVVEPIQGEAGVQLPPAGYLRAAQALCARAGTLLVLDEVQTGLGRTGTMFAFQAEGFVPDVLVLAKSLSGGLVPVSATVTSQELFLRAYGTFEAFDAQASTFGGNGLACTAGLETLAIVASDGLCAAAEAQGAQLQEGLRARLAGHPLVREVRGRGLLVGLELGSAASGMAGWVSGQVSEKVLGQWLALKLLEQGVICQPASHAWDVLKIEPPLTITPAEVEAAIDAIGGVLDEYRSVAKVLKDVTHTAASQAWNGWRFP